MGAERASSCCQQGTNALLMHALRAGKKFPLEQANEAVEAAQRPGRSSEGKFFLEG